MLDETRLEFLEQERKQLHRLDRMTKQTAESARGALSATLHQELQYAGTRESTPDRGKLAASIQSRAPGDARFQSALQDAASLYGKTLDAQGRTSGLFGRIDAGRRLHDWGGAATAAEKRTAVQQLLTDNPRNAKKAG